jgi:hypothetical protein
MMMMMMMISVLVATDISTQKMVRNETDTIRRQAGNGCVKTLTAIIPPYQVLALFGKADVHGKEKTILFFL